MIVPKQKTTTMTMMTENRSAPNKRNVYFRALREVSRGLSVPYVTMSSTVDSCELPLLLLLLLQLVMVVVSGVVMVMLKVVAMVMLLLVVAMVTLVVLVLIVFVWVMMVVAVSGEGTGLQRFFGAIERV